MVLIKALFGTIECKYSQQTRLFLDKHKIPYQWVDIDKDEQGEEFVYASNKGKRKIPTIVFEDGTILTNPTEEELLAMLGKDVDYKEKEENEKGV